MNVPGYEQLAEVLKAAYDQAANGKGKERHANDLPFPEQRMLGISRLLDSDGGMAYQACKKVTEARGLKHDARERELLGAIVYIAGMVIFHRERARDEQPKTCGGMPIDSVPVLFKRVHPTDWPNESRRVEQAEAIQPDRRDVPSILEPVDLAELMTEEREIREEWDERRMDIIGQNGNDGLHYDALPDGLTWEQAPEWADMLGRTPAMNRLLWCSSSRYRYIYEQRVFEFDKPRSGTWALSEIEIIASRPAADGWIEWDGGKCPVPGRKVDLINRAGTELKGVTADAVRWNWKTNEGDILRYRLSKESSK